MNIVINTYILKIELSLPEWTVFKEPLYETQWFFGLA